MADVNPKVMEMVTAELKADPDVSNPELLEKAKEIDPSVTELTPRQFNATYPLQVKRAMKPRKKTTRTGTKKRSTRRSRRARATDGDRDKIRGVLLELAKDVADADGKGDVVDIVAGIDRYVDRVVKAAG